MRILVTGTSGQIGSVIASMLSSEHDVIGIDLVPGKMTTHELLYDAPAVLLRYFPSLDKLFAQRGWERPKSIDRVYVIQKAEMHLGYRPKHNFKDYLKEQELLPRN